MRTLNLKFFLPLLFVLSACASSTDVVEERIVLSPKRLTFESSVESKSISVTHTCSCPFSWTITAKNSPPWLLVQTSGSGDQANVPVTVARPAAGSLPDSTELYVRSNFGDDTVMVVLLP